MDHAEKDFSIMERYIELLTDYDMWEQMFPKMIINTDVEVSKLVESIIFEDLFIDNDISKLKKYMIRTLKFNSDLVNQIEFLSLYHDVAYNLGGIGEYKLAKKKHSYHIEDELVRDFMSGKFTESFINYCNDGFVISGLDLMEQGLKGKEIEDEKERLEIERFKNEYTD